jgi:uncharacterized protein YndB with AHSA1/START domain
MTIHKSIKVERAPEIAFKVFCGDMSRWWPGGFGKDSKVWLEGRVGGRYYEIRTDGTEFEIGKVTAYEPPSRVAFTFRAPSWDVATLVDVRFLPDGTGTRVELEHSGWEQDAKLQETHKNYQEGWDLVLGHYQSAVAPVTSATSTSSAEK